MKKKLLLTPDQFDAIHIAALAFGGIGSGTWYVFRDTYADSFPNCSVGALRMASSDTGDYSLVKSPVDLARWPLNPTRQNDSAVRRINKRLGRPLNRRVTFAQFVKELNIDIVEEMVSPKKDSTAGSPSSPTGL